jgi:hypothetical protein
MKKYTLHQNVTTSSYEEEKRVEFDNIKVAMSSANALTSKNGLPTFVYEYVSDTRLRAIGYSKLNESREIIFVPNINGNIPDRIIFLPYIMP